LGIEKVATLREYTPTIIDVITIEYQELSICKSYNLARIRNKKGSSLSVSCSQLKIINSYKCCHFLLILVQRKSNVNYFIVQFYLIPKIDLVDVVNHICLGWGGVSEVRLNGNYSFSFCTCVFFRSAHVFSFDFLSLCLSLSLSLSLLYIA
jgi:hypothetical protein